MNATVSLYAYAHLSPREDGLVVFEAAEQQERYQTEATSQIELGPEALLHRGVYNRIIRDYNGGQPVAMTLRTTVDVPAGSGMGGSSALVVAMVEAFRQYLNLPFGEYDIARIAFEIERNDLNLAGGKQDQYAAAFGGFNFMEFSAEGRVVVNPLRMRDTTVQELEASLVLYYSGRTRASATIIEAQQARVERSEDAALNAMLGRRLITA